MNTYKLGALNTDGSQNILLTDSNGRMSSIPPALDNTDYQEYLEWVAEGNTPEPAD